MDQIIIDLITFILACLVLVKSAETLVASLSKLAAYFRMTEFVIGFVVMALATSIPELSIGISSAIHQRPELALGNVIGANVIDLTLVIGIATLLKRGIKIETKTVRIDTVYMFLISLLPIILMSDGEISRIDGIILLIVFALYLIRLMYQKERFKESEKGIEKREFYKNVLMFIVALSWLFISAAFLVTSAHNLAIGFGIPEMIIGLFMIALGTTIPELTFETKAVLSDHKYMALGDCVGSVIANSTLVLGITALIHPITADFLLFITSAFFMLTVAFLFMTFVEAEKHILWQEAIALILLYVLFVIVELSVGSYELMHSESIPV
ncbi:MAG: hypothetical protein DRO94_03855 [Candidatus Altiarchaeales archaeon]|nr:MAG: hypothetical protein DRO94_03855 [Candidatus Altiarchaeales archaeon]HDO81872.1 calcium/sodium antiporter [Candidatus Altiarchaeales archaeon]HEX54521.1 calcium/sodium antiporter [Candidatus Altiarchaeales archaeon]